MADPAIPAMRQYMNDGMGLSLRAMQAEAQMIKLHSDNVAGFGIPGFQRKKPVVTFKEYIDGTLPNAEQHPLPTPVIDSAVDNTIGRLRNSGLALDTALASPGYYQKMDDNGVVELTRDGRMSLDAEGWLRGLDGRKILSAAGTPLRFTVLPRDVEKEVKISKSGDVQLYSPSSGKVISMGRLGIANASGGPAEGAVVRQGYIEDSNVMLQDEYAAFMPIRREFEANRQMYIIQNDALTKMLQELGRAQ